MLNYIFKCAKSIGLKATKQCKAVCSSNVTATHHLEANNLFEIAKANCPRLQSHLKRSHFETTKE